MMYKKYNLFIVLCITLLHIPVMAQNFVVSKKNPQKQSMNKLKEQYADELADAIKMIPCLQKQLASLQEQLINELYTLLDDGIHATKKEMDKRICSAQEFKNYLEDELCCSLSSKSSFIKPVSTSEKSAVDSKNTRSH